MHKTATFLLSLLASMVHSTSTSTIFIHPSTTTTITRLPPPSSSTSTVVVFTHVYSTTTIHLPKLLSTPLPTAMTTTVTTRIQSTTTTTITVSSSFAAASSSPLPLDGSANTIQIPQNSSCTCLAPGAWCGTRSAMEVAINGTCDWKSLYMCKVDGTQSSKEFNCTEFLQPIFGTQAGAGCMEGNAGLNDVCIMPKNETS